MELVESVADLKPAGGVKTVSSKQAEQGDPEFDLDYALESLDHDTELLVSQMQFFLHDSPMLLSDIDKAIEAENAHQLQLAAHRLKGMLGRYAFHDAVALALQLENKGKSGQLDGAQAICQQLTPLVQRLTAAVQQYLQP